MALLRLLDTGINPPSEADMRYCHNWGICLSHQPFISVAYTIHSRDFLLLEQCLDKPVSVIISSQNTLKALAHYFSAEYLRRCVWKVYVIGMQTAALLQQILPVAAIQTVVQNSADFREKVSVNIVHSAYFLGGNWGGTALADYYQMRIVLYQTKLLSVRLSSAFQGIIFNSPSAVRSYQSHKGKCTVGAYFCMGPETYQALVQLLHKQVVVCSAVSSKALLIREACNYLKEHCI